MMVIGQNLRVNINNNNYQKLFITLLISFLFFHPILLSLLYFCRHCQCTTLWLLRSSSFFFVKQWRETHFHLSIEKSRVKREKNSTQFNIRNCFLLSITEQLFLCTYFSFWLSEWLEIHACFYATLDNR